MERPFDCDAGASPNRVRLHPEERATSGAAIGGATGLALGAAAGGSPGGGSRRRRPGCGDRRHYWRQHAAAATGLLSAATTAALRALGYDYLCRPICVAYYGY
ncbi:MAG: hypothetical protein WDN29_01145 [Methylovirgula sp.]